MTVVPYQKEGVPASAGLSTGDCEKAAWAYEPGDVPGEPRRRWRGAGAIDASLAVALGTRLPLSLYELPGISFLQDVAYQFVADNRGKLPGDEPYCKQHPDECQ
ncbi:DUF393 domain-containing protein [Rubrobacter marinus]|uniref:DUF393 domain-containing protein n=1 Tax=Rubrobacter marinus TaxID=2653852 RepID=A0A6G8PVE8_9ACTN|nr:DUF393 domain-containing protein [Rubrobacter marinus]